jgi:hypothetical protein
MARPVAWPTYEHGVAFRALAQVLQKRLGVDD